MIGVIERLRQRQDAAVALSGRADDHLRGLPRRGKARRVTVFDQLTPVFLSAVRDEAHGPQHGGSCFVRREGAQRRFARQLDVDAQTVGEHPKLLDQLRRGAGDGLCVDVAVEAVFAAQDGQCADHQLRRVVRRAQHAGGEKEPFNIVAPVELDGQVGKLLGREGRAARFVRAPVDTVFAVVHTVVREQYLEQRDAPSVCGKAVTAAHDAG